MRVKQEFDYYGNHRLVNEKTGQATAWTGYRRTTFLGGVVGYTAYYADVEGMMSAEAFVASQSALFDPDSKPRDPTKG